MSSCLGKENKLDAEMCCRFIVIGLNEAHISLLQIVVVMAWQFLCFRAVTNELLEAPRPPCQIGEPGNGHSGIPVYACQLNKTSSH